MKLNVPLIRQPKHSADCGVACVAMLLEYYGIDYDYQKLRKEIGVLRWGTSAPQLGLWLLKRGFKAEIVTMHPALFHLYSRFDTQEALVAHLKSLRKTVKPRLNQVVLEHFIAFVQAGGKIIPQIPGAAEMKKEIAAKRPVVSLLTHWFLHDSGLPPRLTFHFNVITGIDARNIFVNDPDWGEPFGGKHQFSIDEYLYAVYASAYGAIDNASFLKVRLK